MLASAHGIVEDNFHWTVLLGWEVRMGNWHPTGHRCHLSRLTNMLQRSSVYYRRHVLFAKIAHLGATSSDITSQRLLFTFLCFGLCIGPRRNSRLVLNWRHQHEQKSSSSPLQLEEKKLQTALFPRCYRSPRERQSNTRSPQNDPGRGCQIIPMDWRSGRFGRRRLPRRR